MKEQMKSYGEALAILAGRDSRKLARNTYLRKVYLGSEGDDRPEAIALRLHETDIIVFHKGGKAIYDSGGWRTVTTKERMNRFGPVKLWSENGVWYACSGEAWEKEGAQGVYTYKDGLFYYHGRICNAAKPIQKLSAIKRQIASYAKAYAEALAAGEVRRPSAADCFYCGMVEVTSGRPLGEVSKNSDHIQSHIEESYFVPSLAFSALKTFGGSQVAYQSLYLLTAEDKTKEEKLNEASKWPYSIGLEQVRKDIRRYVSRQLGFQA